MGKRPAFMFYTGDWKKSPELSLCGPATRGIWIDLMCAIHDLEQRESTILGTPEGLSRLCRCTKKQMNTAINELDITGTAGVERHSSGLVTIICRRMIKDWDARNDAKNKKATQRNGGAVPDLSPDCPEDVPEMSPRSSSSSSSSSSVSNSPSPSRETEAPPEGEGDPYGVEEAVQGVEGQTALEHSEAKQERMGSGSAEYADDPLEGRPLTGPQIMAKWNALAKPAGVKTIGRWSEKAAKDYRATVDKFPDFWEAVAREMPLLDDFGRNLCKFRWLCKARENFVKFADGDYKDVRPNIGDDPLE